MRILNSDIAKFQKIYKDRFGIELDESIALEKLKTLLNQMNLVLECLSPEHRAALGMYMKDENESIKNGQSGTGSNS